MVVRGGQTVGLIPGPGGGDRRYNGAVILIYTHTTASHGSRSYRLVTIGLKRSTSSAYFDVAALPSSCTWPAFFDQFA